MNESEQLLRDELERSYPPVTTEPDWEQVLRRLEPPQRPATSRKPRRRRFTVVAGLALAIVALSSVVLVAPWSASEGFAARASAALGQKRYLRVETAPQAPYSATVDLRTGKQRAARLRTLTWYDSNTGENYDSYYVDGRLIATDDVLPGTGMPQPGLQAFLTGYRNAVKSDTATVVGHTTFRGHAATILRFDASSSQSPAAEANRQSFKIQIHIPGESEDVAVDNNSYQPLWYRFNSTSRNGTTQHWPVYTIESISSTDRPMSRPASLPTLSAQDTLLRVVTPAEASSALGQTARWPGQHLAGLTLTSIRLERLTTVSAYSVGVRRSGLGLTLTYRSGNRQLEIEEAPTPQAGDDFYSTMIGSLGPIAPPGKMRIACEDSCPAPLSQIWRGQLHQDDLYVTLTSNNEALIIRAAKALAPTRQRH